MNTVKHDQIKSKKEKSDIQRFSLIISLSILLTSCCYNAGFATPQFIPVNYFISDGIPDEWVEPYIERGESVGYRELFRTYIHRRACD